MSVAEYFAMPDGKIPRSEAEFLCLQEALASRVRAGNTECAEAMRELVDTATVFRIHRGSAGSKSKSPAEGGGVEIEVSGYLSRLIDPSLAQRRKLVGGFDGSGGGI